MSLTRNEQKERNGKIFCISAIFVPILLIAGYSIFIQSVLENVTTFPQQKHHLEDSLSQQLKLSDYLYTDQANLFVGGDTIAKSNYIYGIEFSFINDSMINYKIDFLEGWKKKNALTGTAKLEPESLSHYKYVIQDKKANEYPALLFLDDFASCKIGIFISKEDKMINNSFAKVKKICSGKQEDLTPLLFAK